MPGKREFKSDIQLPVCCNAIEIIFLQCIAEI